MNNNWNFNTLTLLMDRVNKLNGVNIQGGIHGCHVGVNSGSNNHIGDVNYGSLIDSIVIGKSENEINFIKTGIYFDNVKEFSEEKFNLLIGIPKSDLKELLQLFYKRKRLVTQIGIIDEWSYRYEGRLGVCCQVEYLKFLLFSKFII
eukprot:37300_1